MGPEHQRPSMAAAHEIQKGGHRRTDAILREVGPLHALVLRAALHRRPHAPQAYLHALSQPFSQRILQDPRDNPHEQQPRRWVGCGDQAADESQVPSADPTPVEQIWHAV